MRHKVCARIHIRADEVFNASKKVLLEFYLVITTEICKVARSRKHTITSTISNKFDLAQNISFHVEI